MYPRAEIQLQDGIEGVMWAGEVRENTAQKANTKKAVFCNYVNWCQGEL